MLSSYSLSAFCNDVAVSLCIWTSLWNDQTALFYSMYVGKASRPLVPWPSLGVRRLESYYGWMQIYQTRELRIAFPIFSATGLVFFLMLKLVKLRSDFCEVSGVVRLCSWCNCRQKQLSAIQFWLRLQKKMQFLLLERDWSENNVSVGLERLGETCLLGMISDISWTYWPLWQAVSCFPVFSWKMYCSFPQP